MSQGQKEGSVQFSLQELVRLEEERIREQERDRAREAEAERLAIARAQEERRAAQEAKMRAERERKRAEEARAREEAARLEAIEQAALEHARWSAQMKAQSEEAERLRAHERELERIRQSGARGAGWRGGLLGALVAAAATSAVALGVYYTSIAPQADKREEILKEQVAEREGAVAKLTASLAEQKERIDGLQRQLDDARGDNQKLILELKRLKPDTTLRPTSRPAPGRDAPPRPDKTCPFGDRDPLCNKIDGK
jgi:colicin import membrane protein